MKRNTVLFIVFLFCAIQTKAHESKRYNDILNQSIQSNPRLENSTLYFKEGTKSTVWNYSPNEIIQLQSAPIQLNEYSETNGGIMLWIYNEKPQNDSIVFQFLDDNNFPNYEFSFQLQSKGWRACWIGFQHMKGEKKNKRISAIQLIAPKKEGRLFFDRLTFPLHKINDRTTPDMQMPYNNSMSYRDLWHWCRVWQWEQFDYAIPVTSNFNCDQLNLVKKRLDAYARERVKPKNKQSLIATIDAAFKKYKEINITRSGVGFTGAPLVAPDELNRSNQEITWSDIEEMILGFSLDVIYNQSDESLNKFFEVFEYAIDQGMAYGSGMGTNHHYGYQVRDIYHSAWLLRNEIQKHPLENEIRDMLSFWAALQETRQPYQEGRDELLDSWHTLLIPKTIAALLQKTEEEQNRALVSLSKWVSTSLVYTPGTIGGIKVDGTGFHHGGFYPAYSSGALGMVGQYIGLTNDTEYSLNPDNIKVFKKAIETKRNYSNLHEWGLGIGGRHPFTGKMTSDDIASFAHLANYYFSIDKPTAQQLAADYIRLEQNNTKEKLDFIQKGITEAKAPQGFFVLNYGSAGIYRIKNAMVTLKGYNRDVWGAEIYRRDNRFGRYQSYGSVQIFNSEDIVTRKSSGFVEEGWDWNKIPGTTAIQLPLALLNSPLPGTTMAHSQENYSGTSSLLGKQGLFSMKLMERNLKNFTPDFKANKSVFCFDNRLICIGTDIENSNTNYNTITTLFQTAAQPITQTENIKEKEYLKDGYGNFYKVIKGDFEILVQNQKSQHNKTLKETEGRFASAWINHGKAPSASSYEYIVLIEPNKKELKRASKSYTVIQANNIAHILYDKYSKTTAYSVFEEYQSTRTFINKISRETMVLHTNPKNKTITISVCDPNLNISEKTYTTKEPSRKIRKEIVLQGKWQLKEAQKEINIMGIDKNGNTTVEVYCKDGQPQEFELIQL